jgi:hypothetical protein
MMKEIILIALGDSVVKLFEHYCPCYILLVLSGKVVMDTIIEDIITKRPHLEGPLRFYEKAVRFREELKKLDMPSRPDLNAYPPEFIGRIVQVFLSVFELPEGSLSPLKQALELGEIDFTRLPLLEVPAFSLPYPEDDLTMLLFLLSRSYFFGLRDRAQLDNRLWEEGRCPVCNALPSLAAMVEDGRFQLHCSFCGTVGYRQGKGCIVCGTEDATKANILTFEGEAGFAIHACDACRSYVKIVDRALFAGMTPDLADLIGLPLDIATQGKGYKRCSPNPLGMVRMSASG